MSKTKRNPLQGETGTKAFEPDFAIRDKIGKDVDLRKDVFTADRIAKSQEVINEAANDFFGDAQANVDAMISLCDAIEADASDYKNKVKDIAENAILLRGQSETLGFGLVAKVSDSLNHYCMQTQEHSESAVIVLRKHIDTLRVAFHEKLKGDGGQIGQELIQSLDKLIQKFAS